MYMDIRPLSNDLRILLSWPIGIPNNKDDASKNEEKKERKVWIKVT